MTNKGQTNSEELRIQGLLDRYLHFRSSTVNSGAHLDEDALNAFVEGRFNQRESSSIIKHLIDCSFCLNVTAELTKLELAFADEIQTVSATPEPTKVSDVLKGILSRIFGTHDDVVFAHHEIKEETDDKIETDDKKEV